MEREQSPSLLYRILEVINSVLKTDALGVLQSAILLGRDLLHRRPIRGLYEMLQTDVELELLDATGGNAVVRKRLHVRFLQDYTIVLRDTAWGDGKFLDKYECNPGYMCDTYREGDRTIIVISLRETQNRGDTQVFHIARTIKDGFTKDVEDYQLDIENKTNNASLSIIFPKERKPKRVSIIDRKSHHSTMLSQEHFHSIDGDRTKVTWRTQNPNLGNAYIARFQW